MTKKNPKLYRILRVSGVLLAIISLIGLYFKWQEYKKLSVDRGNVNNIRDVKDDDLTVSSNTNLELSSIDIMIPENLTTWKEFLAMRQKVGKDFHYFRMSLDYNDPGIDQKMIREIYRAGDIDQKRFVLQDLFCYDMTHPNLTDMKKEILFELFKTLLEKDFPEHFQTEFPARMCMDLINYRWIDFTRFLVYAKYFESKNTVFSEWIETFEPARDALKLQLKCLPEEKRLSIRDDLSDILREECFKKIVKSL